MKPFRPAAVLLIAAIACLHVQAFDLHVHEAAGDGDHHHAPAIHQHDAVYDVARDVVPEIEAVDAGETVISVGVFLSPAQDAAPLPGLCAAAPALVTASPRAASPSAVAARAHGPPCADRRLSRAPPQSSSL